MAEPNKYARSMARAQVVGVVAIFVAVFQTISSGSVAWSVVSALAGVVVYYAGSYAGMAAEAQYHRTPHP